MRDDMAAALKDPGYVFSRAEIAYLMATAYRWGYEHRVDEENQAWPPPAVYAFGQWYQQALERERADAEYLALRNGERGW